VREAASDPGSGAASGAEDSDVGGKVERQGEEEEGEVVGCRGGRREEETKSLSVISKASSKLRDFRD
jgi:hypothetical protein